MSEFGPMKPTVGMATYPRSRRLVLSVVEVRKIQCKGIVRGLGSEACNTVQNVFSPSAAASGKALFVVSRYSLHCVCESREQRRSFSQYIGEESSYHISSGPRTPPATKQRCAATGHSSSALASIVELNNRPFIECHLSGPRSRKSRG